MGVFIKLLYKFKSWWNHLGLVVLGFFFIHDFSLSLIYYLLLGFSLIVFGHAFPDKKKISIVYLSIILILSFFATSIIQLMVTGILFIMFIGYLKTQYLPVSAPYKGFGWGLLFLLPLDHLSFSSILFYFFLSIIATISEVFHEAEHFKQDKKEGRTTTAIWLNFKINKKINA